MPRNMQSQEAASSEFTLKAWAWLEANIKRIVVATGILAILVFGFSFFSYQKQQKQVLAGQALTDATMSLTPNSTPAQIVDAYLNFAAAHPGTLAGKRATLQAATALFIGGKYPEAQAQFQKYLDAYPFDALTGQALIGLASSLEAQNNLPSAILAYQKAISSSDETSAVCAKFSLARIYESQGKSDEARNLYTDILRTNPNSSLANDASLRLMQLGAASTNSAKAVTPASNTK